MNPNNTYAPAKTFGKQHVLNTVPRDQQDVKLALTYLDRHAPDLVPMILGGVL